MSLNRRFKEFLAEADLTDRQKLLKLQQALIDALPDHFDVTIRPPDEGKLVSYVFVVNTTEKLIDGKFYANHSRLRLMLSVSPRTKGPFFLYDNPDKAYDITNAVELQDLIRTVKNVLRVYS